MSNRNWLLLGIFSALIPGTLILAIVSSTTAAQPSLKAPPQVTSHVVQKIASPTPRAEEPELVIVITADVEEQDAPQRPDPPPSPSAKSYSYEPVVVTGKGSRHAPRKRHANQILSAIGRKLNALEHDGGVK